MLMKMKKMVARLLRNDEGLETVEYAIITGLIVAATITVIAAIGAWVLAQFQALQTGLGA
jgi:Flp pilus assembly pilin Flp